MHGLLHLMQALPDVLRVQALQQAINQLHSLYDLHWSAFMAQEDRASLQASNGCRHALSPSLCGKAPGFMHLLLSTCLKRCWDRQMAGYYLMLIALLAHGKRWCKDVRKLLQLLVSTACTFCLIFRMACMKTGQAPKCNS